jgi:hypothetical protein
VLHGTDDENFAADLTDFHYDSTKPTIAACKAR